MVSVHRKSQVICKWLLIQKYSGAPDERPNFWETISLLTHSVLWNEGLVPQGCAPATHRTRASFHELYCRCLGKHSQTETSFKTNILLMKGDNSVTSYCVVLMFKLAEIWWLFKEIFVFWSIGYMLCVDADSEYTVDDSDDGWVLDSK